MNRHRAAASALALAWMVASALPCTALDLETALARAVASHPTLESHRQSVEAARHAISGAGAWRSPMLEGGVVNLPTSGGFDQDPEAGAKQRLIVGQEHSGGRHRLSMS